jgi:thiol-disulfide isomerase/thioredoxin
MRRFLHAILLALLTAACTGAGGQEGGVGGFVDRTGRSVIAVEDRQPAPTVVGETLDGEELALADLDGVVVVNFWASWCGPCAREAPHLRAIADEYRGRGVHILGVNVKDRPANARSFERDFQINYPSLFDEAATIASSFGGVGPAALPTTMLLDTEHRVAVRLFGAVTAQQLSGHLDELLAEADS